MSEEAAQYPKPNINIVNGWKKKKYGSLSSINGLTPFIKLYAILDGEEQAAYEQVVGSNEDAITAAEQAGEEAPYFYLPPNFTQSFARALDVEFINQENGKGSTINNIIMNNERGGLKAIEMNPTEVQGPNNFWNGGFGINKISASRMTDTPMSENFTMQVQLNNPSLLKTRYEYNKLVTIGSFYIVMFGWSNNGPNALVDQNERKMRIDMSEEGYYNNGNWRWAIVQLHKFDFNFNSEGQIEGTLDFIAAQNTEMIFNMGGKMSNLSKAVMYFMNSRLLGGPDKVDAAIRSLSVYNPDREDPADVFDSSSLNRLFNIERTGSSEAEGEDAAAENDSAKRQKRFREALLAINGFYGPVRIISNIRSGRRQANVPTTPQGWEEVLNGTNRNFDWAGDYMGEGYGFRPSPQYSRRPGNFEAGGKDWLLSNSWLNFFPLQVENGEWKNGRNNSWNPPSAIRTSQETITGTGKFQRRNENSRIQNVEGFITSSRLASSSFDKFFIGKAIFTDILEKMQPEVATIMRRLPEGVIVTKLRNKYTTAQYFDNSTFKVKNVPGASAARVVESEDIIYYYLGWVIEAFKYYQKEFGGREINILHSPLINNTREPLHQKFINVVTSSANEIYKEASTSGGEDPVYDTLFTPKLDFGKTLEQSNDVYQSVQVSDIPSRPDDFDGWARNAAGAPLVGLYYSEAVQLFGNRIIDPNVEDYWKDNGYIDPGKSRVPVPERWWNGIRKYIDPDAGIADLFIPVGSYIPLMTLKSAGNEDEGRFEELSLYGGFEGRYINNTCEVPLDANKVDDILSDSEGRPFADIINQLLTKCCAIPELNLAIIPNSNGDLVISPTGSLPADPKVFNADYNANDVLNFTNESDNFILEYRTKNSLVQDISISSKLDPNISFLYGSSVRATNNKQTVLKFINDARANNPDSQDFSNFAAMWLDKNMGSSSQDVIDKLTTETNQQAINGYISSSGQSTVLTQDQADIIESLPEDLFSAYLATDYQLYRRLQIQQMNESNYVNEMFTYYMNKLTANIHGHCGLECMQFVQLRNVTDLIDGFYCITGVTEEVDLETFNTIIELMLICPSTRLTAPPPAPPDPVRQDPDAAAQAMALAQQSSGLPQIDEGELEAEDRMAEEPVVLDTVKEIRRLEPAAQLQAIESLLNDLQEGKQNAISDALEQAAIDNGQVELDENGLLIPIIDDDDADFAAVLALRGEDVGEDEG